MFNSLLAATVTHYFDPSSLTGKLLISAIVILGIAVIANLLVFFKKKDYFKKSLLVTLAVFLVFCIVAIALSASAQRKEGTAEYQLFFTISTIVALVVGVAIMVLSKKATGAHYKKISWIVAGVLAALTITFFVLSLTNSGGGKLIEMEAMTQSSSMYLAITIFTMVLLGVVLLTIGGNKENTTTEIVYAAICIAIAFALSYIRVFKLPQGGSITLASLVPLAFYSYKFGVRKGIMCCFIYGLMQSLQDPWIVHPLQYLLDYPLAFACIGVSGVFRDKFKLSNRVAIVLGLFAGVLGRYFCHAISGALFFGLYGAEFGVSAWGWGFLYNAFVFPDALVAMVALFFLMSSKEINRLLLAPDIRRRSKAASAAAVQTAGAGDTAWTGETGISTDRRTEKSFSGWESISDNAMTATTTSSSSYGSSETGEKSAEKADVQAESAAGQTATAQSMDAQTPDASQTETGQAEEGSGLPGGGI